MMAKVALITGSARRVGAKIAQTLHQQGFAIALHCHQSGDEARQLSQQLNQIRAASCQVFQADLCNSRQVEQLVNDVLAWNKSLAVLVNNASVFMRDESENTLAHFDKLFNTNVKACLQLSQLAHRALADNHGCIVNITDIHASKPLKGYAAYCMSKAALVMQTKALALEFAPYIRVNAVAPGAVAWPEGDNSLDTEQQKNIVNKIPLQRHGDADAIASAVMQLINNDYISGQELAVDGGRSLK